MEYYFAPMEGITGYIHRNVHHSMFPGIKKYFTAFIAPGQKGRFSSREKNDIAPEHNQGICTVPQILTNQPEDFLMAAEKLKQLGYGEINLNLGCPSKTVVTKYRGAGFLAKPKELDRFFREVFDGCTGSLGDMKISVKTRLGMEDPEEFYELLSVYNQYPISELIIHPRTQADYYTGRIHMDLFRYGWENSVHPVCYNGDIVTREDACALQELFPDLERLMIGRGLLRNPGLVCMMQGEEMPAPEKIREYHDRIFRWYQEEMPGQKPVLFKMKELWFYMGQLFEQGEKYCKKIRKAEKLSSYEKAVEELFSACRTVQD